MCSIFSFLVATFQLPWV